MITDTKKVKEVVSNHPKKGWKITWQDGRYDNIFDNGWLEILEAAQAEDNPVTVQKEKNDKGYWNIVNLDLASMEDAVKSEGVKEVKHEANSDAKRDRSMALSYVKDLIEVDKIPLKDWFKWATACVKFIKDEHYEQG